MRSVRLTFFLFALLAVLSGSRLQAQSANYLFRVPYAVQVQDLRLAPGAYRVTDTAVGLMHLLVIRGSGITTPDGKSHAAAFLSPVAVDLSAVDTSELLVVNRGGARTVVGLRLAGSGLQLTFRQPMAGTVRMVQRAAQAAGSRSGS